MSDYEDREAICLWHELRRVYPDLAPPDERTAEEKKRDTERDIIDLFGPEDKESTSCQSKV